MIERRWIRPITSQITAGRSLAFSARSARLDVLSSFSARPRASKSPACDQNKQLLPAVSFESFATFLTLYKSVGIRRIAHFATLSVWSLYSSA